MCQIASLVEGEFSRNLNPSVSVPLIETTQEISRSICYLCAHILKQKKQGKFHPFISLLALGVRNKYRVVVGVQSSFSWRDRLLAATSQRCRIPAPLFPLFPAGHVEGERTIIDWSWSRSCFKFLTTQQFGTGQFSLENTSVISLAARGDLITWSCVIWRTQQRTASVSDVGLLFVALSESPKPGLSRCTGRI